MSEDRKQRIIELIQIKRIFTGRIFAGVLNDAWVRGSKVLFVMSGNYLFPDGSIKVVFPDETIQELDAIKRNEPINVFREVFEEMQLLLDVAHYYGLEFTKVANDPEGVIRGLIGDELEKLE
ncbi:hypothetical protein [Acetobacterium wieringae]|uniref:hypothetical protein n=1 Tax=Acetobacterium wieringae TaxID=52694 RepID=UPI0020338BD4|nr:hypothetical protein [Acetobacterium wieringae]URN85830.1 hypothetical protein CHL1_001504 [Acetobacterium wieringae]